MSHFTVLVVGPENDQELEDALAPFDEDLEVEPYLEADFDPEESLASARAYFAENPDRRGELDLSDDLAVLAEYHGGTFERRDGVVVKVSTYNPDSKWDWYQVGGRWGGFFMLKEAGKGELRSGDDPLRADRARKGDVDFTAMREKAREEAAEAYDRFEAIFVKHGSSWPGTEWTELDRQHPMWQTGRDAYWSSSLVLELQRSSLTSWGELPHTSWGLTRDEHVELEGLSATSTYARLVDGTWHEPGRMGWFGMDSSSSDSRLEEYRAAASMLDSLDDDVVLTVVDCHI